MFSPFNFDVGTTFDVHPSLVVHEAPPTPRLRLIFWYHRVPSVVILVISETLVTVSASTTVYMCVGRLWRHVHHHEPAIRSDRQHSKRPWWSVVRKTTEHGHFTLRVRRHSQPSVTCFVLKIKISHGRRFSRQKKLSRKNTDEVYPVDLPHRERRTWRARPTTKKEKGMERFRQFKNFGKFSKCRDEAEINTLKRLVFKFEGKHLRVVIFGKKISRQGRCSKILEKNVKNWFDSLVL